MQRTTAPKSKANLKPLTKSPALNYLFNNPDVMAHVQAKVRTAGVPVGDAFQRALEQAAINHYNNFGVREGRRYDGPRTLALTAMSAKGTASKIVTVPHIDPAMLDKSP